MAFGCRSRFHLGRASFGSPMTTTLRPTKWSSTGVGVRWASITLWTRSWNRSSLNGWVSQRIYCPCKTLIGSHLGVFTKRPCTNGEYAFWVVAFYHRGMTEVLEQEVK